MKFTADDYGRSTATEQTAIDAWIVEHDLKPEFVLDLDIQQVSVTATCYLDPISIGPKGIDLTLEGRPVRSPFPWPAHLGQRSGR